MSNCCASSGCGSNTEALCPVSGTMGAGVELQTVKAMLTEVALRQVTIAAHYFCSDPACHIVYFAEDGRTYSQARSSRARLAEGAGWRARRLLLLRRERGEHPF